MLALPRLVRALVHIVQMVDRPDELVTFLGQLGRDHRKFAVVSRHYDAVGVALIAALKRFLKEKWTTEVESAWTSAYGLIAKTMREAAQAETGPAAWSATHARLALAASDWPFCDSTRAATRPAWCVNVARG